MIKVNNSKYAVTILVAFYMMSSVFIGNSWNNSNITGANLINEGNTISSVNSIIIDGNLSVDEWNTAVHKAKWYMDADPENSDGYNYMYIDEDIDNLYLALDLCSDQTNNESGEWVGVWLNTNNTVISNSDEWAAKVNQGMESLIYDVENDQLIPFFDPSGFWDFEYYYIEQNSDFVVLNGTLSGDAGDLFSSDNQYLNITSEYNGSYYISRMDLEMDFYSLFDSFPELYSPEIFQITVFCDSLGNVTINEHFLSIADEQAKLNQDIRLGLPTGTSSSLAIADVARENFTSNTKTILSFNGIDNAPFVTSYDRITVEFRLNYSNFIGAGTVDHPYTSIEAFDIAWSFGPTVNNASDHRQFEIKIPKSELEGYSMDTDLGLLVGGYGTLISFPNTHNWVYANNTLTGIPEEDSTEYNNFSMPMKGWSPPGVPVLDIITPDPDPDGNVLVNWNDDVAVENWTIYRHSSEITEFNLDSAAEIASGVIESQYNDTGLSNGTYWYAVVAIDSFGYSHLSNSLSVTVEIPAPPSTPTTPPPTTTPPPSPIDQQMLLLIGGAGAVIVLVVIIIIVRKR
ncbi:MAG: hypothetical protein ACXABC_01020 [Candidatus Thorarchaeota archaeon]|jgi:hypothetical protein